MAARPHRLARRLALTLALLAWAAVVLGGFGALSAHQAGPGAPSRAPQRWPAGSGLEPSRVGPTLLVFAHPRCPCTRATLRELERLLARRPSLNALVLFWTPSPEREDFAHTDLWERARRVPGLRVELDPGGARARLFGARTSGEVALYDARGALLFHGGITPARGHEGDNEGESALLALSAGEQPSCSTTGVFGCPLEALPAAGQHQER